tara:strand:+ start:197 stop:574 length:378 start_codon:yes stop_codon:yes gene_type:complete
MERNIVFMILFLIGLLILSGCNPRGGVLSDEEVKGIVNQHILPYCQTLESVEPDYPGYQCPTCKWEWEKESIYSITRENSNIVVDISLDLIYGGRNDQPGTSSISVILDNTGNVLEANFSEKDCI